VNLDAGELPVELRKLATSLKIESGRWFRARNWRWPSCRLSTRTMPASARAIRGRRRRMGGTLCDHRQKRDGAHRRPQGRGRAESLDDDGALLVRSEHGHLERIIGGDVTLEK